MNILKIETTVEELALKKPFITALRRVDSVAFVRIRVTADDGSVAFGEAPATKAITGEDIESIVNASELLKDALLEMDVTDAVAFVAQSEIGSSAKAMFDMAFMGLLGFFTLKDKRAIKTDITISLNTIEKMLEDAVDAFSSGMDILKVKLGSDIDHAIEVTKLLSKILPKAQLLIDANQAWSLEASLLYVDALKEFPLMLIEQPVVAADLAGLKTITERSSIPILADEAVFTLIDAKHIIHTQSANMINIKLMKCGGVSRAVEILEYARREGVSCMLGSMLEGPYSINAALYLAFNYRDVIKYVDLDSPLLYKEPLKELDFVYEGAKIVAT